MSGARRERIVEIVAGAMERPAEERGAYVAAACADDEAVRDEVMSLVVAAGAAGSFLDQPTARAAAQGSLAGAVEQPGTSERPGMMIGRYKLLEQIGEGGFGVVYMAEQREPVQRRVALKVIKLGMDTRAVVARFEAERQALALMDHPGVAKVLDAGATPGGRPYFVMELVRGDAITRYCDRNQLTIAERLGLFAQVCHAVQHAHSKGLIHRDIKPGNVLVTTVDGRATPRIIDFGIAKATQSRLTERTVFTEFRQLLGTPEYMSPEQAEGSLDIDTRSDVYSLGVLLYELLTGSTPLDGPRLRSAAFAEMQRMIREEDPPRPSTKLSQQAETLASVAATRRVEPRRLGVLVRGELDWIVMKALEKNRARRYAAASALAEDVERYLGGRAVEAAPPSRMYQVRTFVRRHRVGATTAALVGVALVLGVIGTGLGLVQARRERDRALSAEALQAELRSAAETEAKRSEVVAGFLSDMLRGVGPAVAQGRDTSVLREILERTSSRLEKGELGAHPEAEADLRHVLGLVFSDLRDDGRAIAEHRAGLAARVRANGAESREALLSMNDLAVALWRTGQYDETESLQRRVLEVRRRTLKPDDPAIAVSLNNLGMLLKEKGDLPGAERAMREALGIRERVFGRTSAEYVSAAMNLATVLYEREDYAGAEEFAREAVERGRVVRGNRHPDYAASVNTLAFIRQALGDDAGAERLLRENLEICRAIYDDGHPMIVDALENLGVHMQRRAAEDAEAAAEAVGLLRESLTHARRRVEAAPGESKADSVQAVQATRIMQELGQSLLDAGKHAEAERVLDECVAMRSRMFPDGHPWAWTRYLTMGLLADAIIAQPLDAERSARAEALGLSAAEWFRSNYRPSNEDSVKLTRRAAERLADFYSAREMSEPGQGWAGKAEEWRMKRDQPPASAR